MFVCVCVCVCVCVQRNLIIQSRKDKAMLGDVYKDFFLMKVQFEVIILCFSDLKW